MTEKTPYTVVCPFCGRERTVTNVHDDGMDYLGHARGQVSNYKLDNGCDCPLGKLVHEKVAIRWMCYNCNDFKAGQCTNKAMLDEVNGMFQMPPELKVKHPDKCCAYWSLNLEIFKDLLKEDNK